jgi:arsenate reductase (glutaredoxin)
MIILYGIKNCDSVKDARKWLDKQAIVYEFHDFRVQGISEKIVSDWLKQQPLELLINKRSTTWKSLSDACKNSLNKDNAPSLCVEHETLIKRPVLSIEGKIYLGFDETTYTQLLKV